MKKRMTRERIAALVLTLAGVALAAALAYNPRMPGPSRMVDWMFRPAVVMIEQLSAKRSG
ncbi:MAG: hypothetical protein C6W55_12020 [Thermobacillus sp.]|jgi:hypothetical protein|uniref:Uncharacterized protein n=2 Tax=Thermobacillus TaxID=76632 RepID=L0EF39_THECK|nr:MULTISPECIES: hypothetical protein [Thermobacillus]AGA58883.1 hypothetical protein Theco_2794 [Thermobacillus composti KWC4]REJ15559.1 MAG: hypothetical protein C6W59_08700 [Paenibacillaceae bacterium]REK54243.1 MAG: hypothetical protein C6W55_12020 [Thermobacillus sp.]CAG5091686.1 Uncharacterized protein TXXE_16120 [Thermobacillus xylanilyticus]